MKNSKVWAITGIYLGTATIASLWSATYVALPSIQLDLHASPLQTQWIVNIYGIFIASALVICGQIADQYGHRSIFLIGLIMAFIAMLGIAIANSATQIIVFQALFGLAGAIILPVSQALISNIYPPHLRTRALGFWGFAVGLALSIGPTVGGILITLGSWRTLFCVGALLPVTSMILILKYCPPSIKKLNKLPLDIKGALILAATITSFIIGIDEISHIKLWEDSLLFIFSIILLILLLIFEKNVTKPILCPRLWTNKQFLAACIANFCMLFIIWALFFIEPYYMQTGLKLTAAESGLIMLAITLPLSVFSAIIGVMVNYLSLKFLILIGFIIMLASFYLQLTLGLSSGWFMLFISLICFGIGWGLVWTPSINIAITTIGETDAGLASGSVVTVQEIGGTVGLAIIATTMRYHYSIGSGMHSSLLILMGIAILGCLSTIFIVRK